MTDVGDLLRRAAGDAPVFDGPTVVDKFRRRRRRRRVGGGLVVVAFAIVAVPVVQQATSDDPVRVQVVDGPTSTSPAPAPAPETTVVSEDVPFDVPAGYEVGVARQRSLSDGATARTWTVYVPGPMEGVRAATIHVTLLYGEPVLDDVRALRSDDATALRHWEENYPDMEPVVEMIGGRRVVASRDHNAISGDDLGLPDKPVHRYVIPSDSADGIVQVSGTGATVEDVEAIVATLTL